jgi:signal transduction histidine kinase
MSEPGAALLQSSDAALLDKIEQLSLLRSLSDRLAQARDFASACRTLVQVVWEEACAEAVVYLSVDAQRRVCHLQAAAPDDAGAELPDDVALATAPLPALLAADGPVVLRDLADIDWLDVLPPSARQAGTALICAPMRVRGTMTGLLVVSTREAGASLEETRRLLAIIAASAALALDVARNDEREEFLATLRHDINNPVNAALGYAEMIIDGLKAEHAESLVPLASSMVESLKAVADLVSNYLHMAAIDRGAPSLHLDEIDLGALTAEIVDRLRPPADECELTLVRPDRSVRVLADRRQLGRVITNLVGNALKYTPRGGRIRVTVAGGDSGASIVVADAGYGIAPEDVARLFTKYARFHRDRGIPGTGLGLYICKAIVEAHGGTIAVESVSGRGSTFTVWLPRFPA